MKLIENQLLEGINRKDIDCELLKTVNSTNTYAKDAHLNKKYLLVISEQQTQGRGRHGKEWYSPDSGNIYMSIKFKSPPIHPPLSLISGLLVSEAMQEVSNNQVIGQLKWPNDILVNQKKICGILVESQVVDGQIEFIIGIGINYALPKKESWWGELDSMGTALPQSLLINSIVKKIIEYDIDGYPSWQSAWVNRCMHVGQEIVVRSHQDKEITGIFRGIAEQGEIQLETSEGLKLISSGEFSIQGLY